MGCHSVRACANYLSDDVASIRATLRWILSCLNDPGSTLGKHKHAKCEMGSGRSRAVSHYLMNGVASIRATLR